METAPFIREKMEKQNSVPGLGNSNSCHVPIGLKILMNCDETKNIGIRNEVVMRTMPRKGMCRHLHPPPPSATHTRAAATASPSLPSPCMLISAALKIKLNCPYWGKVRTGVPQFQRRTWSTALFVKIALLSTGTPTLVYTLRAPNGRIFFR
jgi:hypothetical protein